MIQKHDSLKGFTSPQNMIPFKGFTSALWAGMLTTVLTSGLRSEVFLVTHPSVVSAVASITFFALWGKGMLPFKGKL